MTLPDGVRVRFRYAPAVADTPYDVAVLLTSRKEIVKARNEGRQPKADLTLLPSLTYFWTPLLLAVSLTLATPLSRRRMLRCLGGAIGLILLFLAVRFGFTLHYALVNAPWLLDQPPGPVLSAMVTGMWGVLNNTQWFSSIIAVLVWLLVSAHTGWFRNAAWR